MTHNLQTRSFSIDAVSAQPIKTSGSAGSVTSNSSEETNPVSNETVQTSKGSSAPLKVNSFRSASIGSSSFFPHKEASTFFNKQDFNSVSADDEAIYNDEGGSKEEDEKHDVEDEDLKSSNLDIVGALNNLDLDEDFSIPDGLDNPDSDGKVTPDSSVKVADKSGSLSESTTGLGDSAFLASQHPHFLPGGPLDPHPIPYMYLSHEYLPDGVTMSPSQHIGSQYNAFSANATPRSNSWKQLHGMYPSSTTEVQRNDFGINIQKLKLEASESANEQNEGSRKGKAGQATGPTGTAPNSALQSPSNGHENYLGFSTPPPVGFVQRGTPSQFLNEGGFFGENVDMNNYINGAGHIPGYPAPVPPHQPFDGNGKNPSYPMGPMSDNMLWQQRAPPMGGQVNHPMLPRNNAGTSPSAGGNPRSMNMSLQGTGPGVNGNNHFGGGRFNRGNSSHYANDGNNGNMNGNIPNNGGHNFDPNHGHHHHGHANNHGGMRRNDLNSHRKMNNRRKGDDASKYVNARLEDFTGEIYSLCKDQHGCRFLQRQLDLGNDLAQGAISDNNGLVLTKEVAATMIFNEIYLKIIELMIDPFGNYLIQKLFENISTAQRIILVKNASPEFIRIALDPHGTRALQKLVECINTKEESKLIIESLSPHIVTLSRDLNGNHVVQKCLQKLTPEDNQFIFETASMHCNEIATHRHGCCVLQRCLDHGNADQRKQLSLKVAENATSLSLDPFGNYVVQYVLSRGDDKSITIILDHIKANVIKLLLHKFGSNVIEKSLRINKLTESLISVLLENSDKFSDLLNDAYGNYVLQTSLDVASGRDLARLAGALQPLLVNIKNTPHGRRILTKIQNVC